MKHLLFAFLLLTINTARAQFSYKELKSYDDYYEPKSLNLKLNNISLGDEHAFVAGGSLFIALALSTQNENRSQKFYQPLPRGLALLTGSTLVTTGIILYINTSKRR